MRQFFQDKSRLGSFGVAVPFALSLALTLNLTLALTIAPGAVLADQFNVDEMPEGAEVTLPGAATTMVPVATKIKLESTDAPQTVSIVPVATGGRQAVPVQLSIYDTKLDRVRYVQISPGAPFLYSFRGLSAITLQTDVSGGAKSGRAVSSREGIKLKIESDKPLTVSR
ncbi:MAG: hypothetical protein NTV34_14545 [Proteobacteria bacterium]|nr:hypothetical protein [Pseudomonadota bacterium]